MVLKKFTAIALFSVYLLSTTELHQLVKLPVLIEHFIEHRQENKNITLWGFLYMHYAQSDDKDGDYDKDMKLPFKAHDCAAGLPIAGFTPQVFVTTILKPTRGIRTHFPVYQEAWKPSAYLSTIWQPPKFC